MRAPEPLPRVDALILESTYGDRQHEAVDVEQALGVAVRQVARDGGTLLVPAFAVGRVQLLMHHLARLVDNLRCHREGVHDALESYIRGLMAASSEQKHRLFTQAARLDERFSQPCFQLGRLQFAEKNYRAAAGWFERVPRGSPHYLEAAYFLALCRYQLAEYDKAIGLLEEVAAALPLNEVWNNLGAAQSRRNLPEAAESFRKAHEGDPNDPAYLFNLGYALWKAGRYDEAAEDFRAVLDRTPEDPQAILMLGRCLAKTPPKDSDLKVAGLERLKENFEEMAYRQLRATLDASGKR